VFFSNQSADLNVTNLHSNLLGLSGASFGGLTDLSTYPLGYNIPTIFGASGLLTGPVDSPCENGCDAAVVVQLSNANGRIADAALPAVAVMAPPDINNVVDAAVSENPYAPIPRP
jgi:hypothetical protein